MRGFSFTLPYTLWVTPEFFFAKWKTLWRYTIVVSFTIITFVAAKLTFQSLAYLISISACYEIGQHRDKKYIYIFKKNVIFFYSARFINVWGGQKIDTFFYHMNKQSSRGFQRYKNFGTICWTDTSYKTFLILLIRLNVLILNHVITINKA